MEKDPLKTVKVLDNVCGIGMKTVEIIRNDAAVADPKADKTPIEKADKKLDEKSK